jgi:hypothetical protein
MKTNILKILTITALMVFIGTGVALADGWKHAGGKPGYGYGHYKHDGHHDCDYYAPPRPVYVEHHYCPVIVERHYHHEPVRYIAPAPNGFFFGMSVAEPGSAFSFGVSGW